MIIIDGHDCCMLNMTIMMICKNYLKILETVNRDDHNGNPLQLAEQHSYQSNPIRLIMTTTALGSFLSSSDENVGPASSAFYLGIFYTMAIGELSKTKKNVFKSSLASMIMHAQWTTKT